MLESRRSLPTIALHSVKVDTFAPNTSPNPVEGSGEPMNPPEPCDDGFARAAFLRKLLATSGAVFLGGSVASAIETGAASTKGRDERILNFVLLLQYVEAGFYAAATDKRKLSGELASFASTVAEQEREHVKALRSVLGAAARAKPQLRYGSAVTDPSKFVKAAIMLEEQTCAGCIGEGAHLSSTRLTDVARLLSVDARHAAWIRSIARRLPAPRAADAAAPPDTVLTSFRAAGFLSE